MDELKVDEFTGRRFTEVGDEDCFHLVRIFYKENFGIDITNYARPSDWRADASDLITQLHEREGFIKIGNWKPKDIRPGDVIVMSVGEANPNHLGIYVGNDEMLHHQLKRLSRKEQYSGVWHHHTAFLLRHPDVPDLRPVPPIQDLAEFIDARNAPPTDG